MADIVLWGFNGSTYVRTVRMLLAEKGVAEYRQEPVDVLKGEPKQPEHLARHPFGKVPVVDIDGFRIIETEAITHYLDTVLPGQSFVPAEPRARARMDMVINVIDSYGYPALVGVAGHYLFPEFIGGQNEAALKANLGKGTNALSFLFGLKGSAPYLTGEQVSLADFYLAPILAYASLTPHWGDLLGMPGLQDWWSSVSARDSFKVTAP